MKLGRRGFLGMLGAAVAAVAIDPMFGGSLWGMDQHELARPKPEDIRVAWGGISHDYDVVQELVDEMAKAIGEDMDRAVMESLLPTARSRESVRRIGERVGTKVTFSVEGEPLDLDHHARTTRVSRETITAAGLEDILDVNPDGDVVVRLSGLDLGSV